MLFDLVYASRSRTKLTLENVLQIRRDASRRNHGQGITGFLVAGNDMFLQLLEGERTAVSDTYKRIASDPRHHDVTLLGAAAIPARSFSEWTMGHAMATEARRDVITRFFAADTFDPFELDHARAREYLLTLAYPSARVA